jgi:antitoxin ParD1/3/4
MTSPKNTSIALGEHFQAFVASQVSSGRFGSASEVVRAGLRVLEEREMKLAALRAALDEGERSPVAEGFSLDRVLTRLRSTPR